MLDRAGPERAEQVRLVDDALGVPVTRVGASPDIAAVGQVRADIGGRRAIDGALAVVGLRKDLALRLMRGARGVPQRQPAEVVLHAELRLMRRRVAEVAVAEAGESRIDPNALSRGSLEMKLSVPPADPHPPNVELEPRTICTSSTANTSRVWLARSRTPST